MLGERHPEHQYLDIMREILYHGVERPDRTGVGTKSIFGTQMRFNLADGFPLITTKKVFFKGVVHELLWLLSGNTNIQYLLDNNVHIWDEWASESGDLGPVYGKQWRAWSNPEITTCYTFNEDGDETSYEQVLSNKEIDQIKWVIKNIQKKPYDRGHIVSAWNVADLDQMALRPCHTMFQFYVADGKLSCQLYQRSGDWLLGIPFNIASYSLLTMMVAQVCNLQVGHFVHTIGDAHIYRNHFDGAEMQLKREPHTFPTVSLNKDVKNIDDFKYEDVQLINYKHHPGIKLEVAV